MSSVKSISITVFGATGGCGANALVLALNAGLNCTAMVRDPAKLLQLLTMQYKVSTMTIDTHLTIIQGNVKSIHDIRRTLTAGGHLPDRVLFAVGGVPMHQLSIRAPATLDDPHVCEAGMNALMSALRACVSDNVPFGSLGDKPVVFAISAAGVSNRRDLSLHLYPIYRWYLSTPLADKAEMEKALITAASEIESPLKAFAIVRLMALTNSAPKGLHKIKSGWVWPDEQREVKLAGGEEELGPQIGLGVARADVGH